ncbi:MAG TPA: substrate-binding domain-containing protein [Streptosporangiaceae bacterium]|nr:substrate-binding domain-containing protein [Streptosporangiaceae bacterium]
MSASGGDARRDSGAASGPAPRRAAAGSPPAGGPAGGGPAAGSPAAGGGAPGGSGTGLRLARQARGFSQQQLASMAGISRQAVSAVESGVSDPSLRVALALAHALGMTVEELFGPGTPAPLAAARLVAPLARAGSRVALAPVGERLVALPLTGGTAMRAGFLPAGGRVAPRDAAPGGAEAAGASSADTGPADAGAPDPAPGAAGSGADSHGDGGPAAAGPDEPGSAGAGPGEPGVSLVRPIGPPRPTLLVAGCDPALPLIEAPLSLLDPPVAFAWWPCGSSEALRLAASGLVHVAGAHLRDAGGEYNTGPASELLLGGAEVIRFCSWREGLVLRPGQQGQIDGVAGLPGSGLRLVNRDKGSEARRVLDRELAEHAIDPATLPGYDTRATGHLEVAAAIAAGVADVGVASEPAALAYGLAFIPLTRERFDLVIPAGQAGSREVQAMLRVLSSPWLRDQLASLPGCDPSRCGEHLATLQAPGGRPDRSRIRRYCPDPAR